MFVKYGIDIENRTLLDEVISFAMITGIFMLLPETILMTYRNVFGPMPSIFVTQMLLNFLEVWPEQFMYSKPKLRSYTGMYPQRRPVRPQLHLNFQIP